MTNQQLFTQQIILDILRNAQLRSELNLFTPKNITEFTLNILKGLEVTQNG